jgi:hypothetical protein
MDGFMEPKLPLEGSLAVIKPLADYFADAGRNAGAAVLRGCAA